MSLAIDSDLTAMKTAVWLLLLLYFPLVLTEECSNGEQGDVRIIGTETSDLIAGRLEICVNRVWRAVYDRNWDTREAVVVCTERGFPASGAMACRSSCFGASLLIQGYTNFSCNTQDSLLNCGRTAFGGYFPNRNAGVVCVKPHDDKTTPCLATCCPDTPFPTSCLTTPTECPTSLNIDCPTCPTTDCPFCPSTNCSDCPSTRSNATCPTCPAPTSTTPPTDCSKCSTTCPSTTCPTCPALTTPPPSTCLPCPMPQTTTPQVCPTTSCPEITCPTPDTSTCPPCPMPQTTTPQVCPATSCPEITCPTPDTSTCPPCPMPQTTTPQVCPTTSCPEITCPTPDTTDIPDTPDTSNTPDTHDTTTDTTHTHDTTNTPDTTPEISDTLPSKTDTTPTERQDSSPSGVDSREETMKLDTSACTSIVAFLGVLSIFLLLTLVGVATVWVWSCYRMKRKGTMTVNLDTSVVNASMVNPTYASAIPSQYSALGPRDTSNSHTPNPSVFQMQDVAEETPYEVPIRSRDTKEREEEGADYEVPVPSATGNRYASISISKTMKLSASYDVLQHS